MRYIPSDWVLSHWGEEEIPRYKFLDYIRSLYQDMDHVKLFPAWEDCYIKYCFLKQLEEGLQSLDSALAKELIGADLEKLELKYLPADLTGQAEAMVVKERLAFARPILKKACKTSERARKELAARVEFGPLGLHVANRNEGLLLTLSHNNPEVWSWYYQCGVQTHVRYGYTAIKTRLIGKYSLSLTKNLHGIKTESLEACGLSGCMVSAWVAVAKEELPVLSTIKPIGVLHLAQELGLRSL